MIGIEVAISGGCFGEKLVVGRWLDGDVTVPIVAGKLREMGLVIVAC